jgi:hypothetical protein
MFQNQITQTLGVIYSAVIYLFSSPKTISCAIVNSGVQINGTK